MTPDEIDLSSQFWDDNKNSCLYLETFEILNLNENNNLFDQSVNIDVNNVNIESESSLKQDKISPLLENNSVLPTYSDEYCDSDTVTLDKFYEECYLGNNVEFEEQRQDFEEENNPFSVLGISLDLDLSEDSYLFNNIDDEIEQLLDGNFPFSGSIMNFDEVFSAADKKVKDAAVPETQKNEILLHLQEQEPDSHIINMFPHMNDEKNRRRRCLLYENSQITKTSERKSKSPMTNEYEKMNPRHVALVNHDYTNKFEAEKSIICPVPNCKKIYAKASHLKAHLRRHSGEKPFICDWNSCSWKFSRSDELARHKRSHYGIKPYKCEICEKAFARSDHLAKHRKVHRKRVTLFEK